MFQNCLWLILILHKRQLLSRSRISPHATERLGVCEAVQRFAFTRCSQCARVCVCVCTCFAVTPTRLCCGCAKQLPAFIVTSRLTTMAANVFDACLAWPSMADWQSRCTVKYGIIRLILSTVNAIEAYRCHAIEIKIDWYCVFDNKALSDIIMNVSHSNVKLAKLLILKW